MNPSGIEIATMMLETEKEKGWSFLWQEYDGFRISPRVRIWLDGYTDLDYERGFLLKVWTNNGDDDGQVTTQDHLAVYQQHAGTSMLTVTWRQEPRLFFDGDLKWYTDGLRWWADWLKTTIDTLHPLSGPTPVAQALKSEHQRRDRERAHALGLTLPYLEEA